MGTSRLIVNNEERREVAAKLRETEPFEYGGEKWYDEGKILDALDLSFDNVPSIYDPEKVKHLADLIDRPTCRNIYDESEMGSCKNGFKCSECGNIVEDCEGYCVIGTFNYCSECGREVVE